MPTDDGGLQLRLLGRPALRWRSEEFGTATKKGLALLCYLAVHKGSAPRREVGELLWGEGYAGAMRVELARLRRLPGADAWLVAGPSELSLRARSDLSQFEAAVADGRHEDALAVCGDRRELMQGLEPRNAGAFQDWLEAERERVAGLWRVATLAHAEELARRGEAPAAAEMLRELLAHDPLEESAHRVLMRIAFESGDLRAALRQFELCRRLLAEELGLAPMPETLALAADIERAAAHMGPPARLHEMPRIPPRLLRPPQLVGRERELAQMEEAWRSGRHIFICGPGGVGKSRLMMDFVCSKTTSYSLNVGRPGDNAIPYSSLGRGLRSLLGAYPDIHLEPWARCELARVVPDCFPETPPAVAGGDDRMRLIRALETLLLEASRSFDLLPADDIHLFDTPSFELSLYFSAVVIEHRLGKARVIGCYRSGELSADKELELARAQEAGIATHIDLAPLDENAVFRMLSDMAVEHAAALTPRIHRLTGGHPQFIVETLKVLYSQGWVGPELPERIELPPRVGAAIEQRLGRLTPSALSVLHAVAALQQPSPVHAGHVAAILEIGLIDAGEALAELERAQLVVGGEFVHDLIYDVVSAATPRALARTLHRRIASWLETQAAEPARIARHWLDAGDGDRALPWRIRAADVALAQGVAEPARSWLTEALDVLEPGTELYRQASTLLAAARQLS